MTLRGRSFSLLPRPRGTGHSGSSVWVCCPKIGGEASVLETPTGCVVPTMPQNTVPRGAWDSPACRKLMGEGKHMGVMLMDLLLHEPIRHCPTEGA